MSQTDRILYQATYAPIINKKIRSDDSAKTKKKKKLGRLTLFQKNALLKAAFLYGNSYLSATKLIEQKAKKTRGKIHQTAKAIDLRQGINNLLQVYHRP